MTQGVSAELRSIGATAAGHYMAAPRPLFPQDRWDERCAVCGESWPCKARKVEQHLRNHLTDGQWHDGCTYCVRRRTKGGTGV